MTEVRVNVRPDILIESVIYRDTYILLFELISVSFSSSMIGVSQRTTISINQ